MAARRSRAGPWGFQEVPRHISASSPRGRLVLERPKKLWNRSVRLGVRIRLRRLCFAATCFSQKGSLSRLFAFSCASLQPRGGTHNPLVPGSNPGGPQDKAPDLRGLSRSPLPLLASLLDPGIAPAVPRCRGFRGSRVPVHEAEGAGNSRALGGALICQCRVSEEALAEPRDLPGQRVPFTGMC
jgi:hypothetical protein